MVQVVDSVRVGIDVVVDPAANDTIRRSFNRCVDGWNAATLEIEPTMVKSSPKKNR